MDMELKMTVTAILKKVLGTLLELDRVYRIQGQRSPPADNPKGTLCSDPPEGLAYGPDKF